MLEQALTLTLIPSLKAEVTTRDMTDEEKRVVFMPRSNKHVDESVRGIVSSAEIMEMFLKNRFAIHAALLVPPADGGFSLFAEDVDMEEAPKRF